MTRYPGLNNVLNRDNKLTSILRNSGCDLRCFSRSSRSLTRLTVPFAVAFNRSKKICQSGWDKFLISVIHDWFGSILYSSAASDNFVGLMSKFSSKYWKILIFCFSVMDSYMLRKCSAYTSEDTSPVADKTESIAPLGSLFNFNGPTDSLFRPGSKGDFRNRDINAL